MDSDQQVINKELSFRPALGFGVWGVGCGVLSFGFRILGAGLRVWGLGFRVGGPGLERSAEEKSAAQMSSLPLNPQTSGQNVGK